MQEDLRNRYFQQNQHPNQGPPPPYNPVLQPYEQPTKPQSSGVALAFWLFVLFALMAFAAYFGYFAPLIARLRSKIKELSPSDNDASPTIPASLLYEVMEDSKTEEEERETAMMAQPDINDKFANMMDKYGLLDKSQMNGKHIGEELLNQPPTQQGDEN